MSFSVPTLLLPLLLAIPQEQRVEPGVPVMPGQGEVYWDMQDLGRDAEAPEPWLRYAILAEEEPLVGTGLIAVPIGLDLPALMRIGLSRSLVPGPAPQAYFAPESPRPQDTDVPREDAIEGLKLPASVRRRFSGDPAPEVQISEQTLDLAGLSLEDLMQIEVISVSRKLQTVSDSPAAIYVVTQEDIRRSGHSSIPEVLRMVPGLHVARVNSNSWAISARGFNGRFNNKMLVMIDGRTVFNTLFSGVFWDVQDLHLADIERIEVVRGPGGSLWGANAVNGIINIITKSAGETHGGNYSLRAGNEESVLSGRFGDSFEGQGDWRVYAKAVDRDASVGIDGSDQPDDWGILRGGGRADWALGEHDSLTLQADVYNGRVGEVSRVTQRVPGPDRIFSGNFDVEGANLLGRWSRRHSESSATELQVYVDLARRNSLLYRDSRTTLDLDYQHSRALGRNHELLFGLGYRLTSSEFDGSQGFQLDRGSRADQLLSAFVQDEISLIPDELSLIIGSKFEHNDYTGFEVQPSLRMLWRPAEHQVVWGAVSRAVRTPSVVQSDLIQDAAETTGPTSVVRTTLFGNDDLGADVVLAYELGWRCRVQESLYLDMTAFYNDFSAADNFSVGPTINQGGGSFVVPVFFDNSRQASVLGAELAMDLELSDDWKVRSGVTFLDLEFNGDVLGTPIQPLSDAEEPNYVGNLRSYWSVSDKLDVDLGLYAVDDLDDLLVGSYLRVDARVAYRPSPSWELALGVQNITQDEHDEFASTLLSTATNLQRSAYFDLTWAP